VWTADEHGHGGSGAAKEFNLEEAIVSTRDNAYERLAPVASGHAGTGTGTGTGAEAHAGQADGHGTHGTHGTLSKHMYEVAHGGSASYGFHGQDGPGEHLKDLAKKRGSRGSASGHLYDNAEDHDDASDAGYDVSSPKRGLRVR
jgi:hypothetical protein